MRALSQWKDALTKKSSMRGDDNLECISCIEKFSRKSCIVAPCSHVYCRRCVANLVETCLRDEQLFPVKCCMQCIPTAQLTGVLKANLQSRFNQKSLEFSTSADWRVYCCNASCSAFLGSSCGETKSMKCSACRKSTCTGCKQSPHPAGTCQGNDDTLKVRRLAQKERWQTCPGCSAIVEQKAGCNHMTCRCRSEFCYLCGVKWKTCGCPQFGDPRPSSPEELSLELEVAGNELDGDGDGDGDVRGEDVFLEQEPTFDGEYINPYDAPLYIATPPPYSVFDEWDGNVPDFNSLEESSHSSNVPQPPAQHDSSGDEGPYINPYHSGLGPGSSGGGPHPTQRNLSSSDEDFSFNPYDPVQDFESLFFPDREAQDSSDNEGSYINPYDPTQSHDETIDSFDPAPDYSTSFADLQIGDTSDENDLHADSHDPNPDSAFHDDISYHFDTSDADDEGTYSDWNHPEPENAFSRLVTQYYDVPDSDDGPYINPYDPDPPSSSSTGYCPLDDEDGSYVDPYDY